MYDCLNKRQLKPNGY